MKFKKKKQEEDILQIKKDLAEGKAKSFRMDDSGVVYFGNRLVIPKSGNVKGLILQEAHESRISIHPGSTKMYQDLRRQFWWSCMKREIAEYVAECDICRRVKAKHQRPVGTLRPIAVPEWK